MHNCMATKKEKEMKKVLLGLGLAVSVFGGIVFAQQAATNIVVGQNSKDCKSTYLIDAANTILGPYTNQDLSIRLAQGVSQRQSLLEQVAQMDAKIQAAMIGLASLNQCVINNAV